MPFAKYKGHRQRHIRGGKRVIGVPHDEHSTTEVFGTEFPRGYWVPVDHLHPDHQKKLAGNPGFEFADKPVRNEPTLKPEEVVHTGLPQIAAEDPWVDAVDLDEKADRRGQADEGDGADA